jgi:hypothetical protein
VSEDEEPSLREQLVAARGKISRQLDILYARASGRTYLFPPDFRQNIAELEVELREIDALLTQDDKSRA